MAESKRPVPSKRDPQQPTSLRGVLSDADIAALRRRNEWRLKGARESLGDRYALHPANRVQSKRNVGLLAGFIARLGGF